MKTMAQKVALSTSTKEFERAAISYTILVGTICLTILVRYM